MKGFVVSDLMKVRYAPIATSVEEGRGFNGVRQEDIPEGAVRYILDWDGCSLPDSTELAVSEADWDNSQEKKYITAWQAASKGDCSKVKRLFREIDFLFKKHTQVVSTIEPAANWSSVKNIVNACIVGPMLLEAMGNDLNRFLKHYTVTHSRLLLFLLSDRREEFLKTLLKPLGEWRVGELRKTTDTVLQIVEKLKAKIDDGYEGWENSLEVQFWISEYCKRKFLQVLVSDDELNQLMNRLLVILNENMKNIYSEDEIPCSKCPFRSSFSMNTLCDTLIVKESLGCLNHSTCKMALAMTELVVLNLFSKPGGYLRPKGVEGFSDDVIQFCVHVSKRFGVCIHELFSLSHPSVLIEHLEKHGRYPARQTLLDVEEVAAKNKASTVCTLLTARFKQMKSSFVLGQYNDLKEERIVGLYLWDLINLRDGELRLTDEIRALMKEGWYCDTELGKRCASQFEKDLEQASGSSRKGIIDRHREYCYFTEECIEQTKLLNIEGALKAAKSTKKRNVRKRKKK